ncbi:MAG: D-aminoacyl-tRNA deacylase [Actinobacteria bacterium]|nr:D-aminoacyl-tRNA deacylase [Actinomycetota bacterium]
MKAVIQRVSRAKVSVGGAVKGEVGRGLLVLLGVAGGDDSGDAAFIAGKAARLRIFPDGQGLMNRSVAEPALAERLYREVVDELRSTGIEVQTGEFGAMMEVELVNDGPVTIILESPSS